MTVVFGLSAFYHDSDCGLIVDGELPAAGWEERFSQRKHDGLLVLTLELRSPTRVRLTLSEVVAEFERWLSGTWTGRKSPRFIDHSHEYYEVRPSRQSRLDLPIEKVRIHGDREAECGNQDPRLSH